MTEPNHIPRHTCSTCDNIVWFKVYVDGAEGHSSRTEHSEGEQYEMILGAGHTWYKNWVSKQEIIQPCSWSERFINCSCLGFPWNKRANLGLWIFDNFGTTVNVNLTFLWRLKNWQFWTKPDISPSAPAHILALFGSFIFNSLRSMVSTFVNGVQQLIWTFPGASQRFGGRVGAVQTKYKVSIGRCSSAAGGL